MKIKYGRVSFPKSALILLKRDWVHFCVVFFFVSFCCLLLAKGNNFRDFLLALLEDEAFPYGTTPTGKYWLLNSFLYDLVFAPR